MWSTVIVTSLLLWTNNVDGSVSMANYVEQGKIKYQQIMQKRNDYAAYDVDPNPHSCRWAMGKMQHQEGPDGVECEAQAINQLQTTKLLLAIGQYTSLANLQNDQDLVDAWRVSFPYCFDGECVGHCNDPIKTYYRTADGSCNNEHRRTWGKSFTAQQRFMDPAYGDQYNVGDPREYSVAQDGDGNHYKLPAARAVSVAVFGDSDEYNDDLDHKFTVEFMAWGQFTDHDVVFTPTSAGSGESNINCCHTVNGVYLDREECFHMVIQNGDHRFTKTCMNFIRSVPATRTDGYCKPSWREQLNQVTAFIDGSNVYGSTYTKQHELRDTGSNSHLLQVHGHDLPAAGKDSECILPNPKGDMFCLKAGDERSNEVTNLGYHHILFVRLHNKIADKLKHCWRPHDYHFETENIKNEYYFQEARKIIIAIMQKITYKDWLPKVIGSTLMKKHKLRVGYHEDNAYDPYENPTIHNAFAAAAFRFGHSLIPRFQSYNIKDPETPYYYAYKDQTFTTHDLKDVFFRPNLLQQDQTGYLDEFSNWLLYDRCKMSDRRFTKMVTDHLFEDSVGDAFDLAALNIQRGRDHGIKGYTRWREFAGFDAILTWHDLEHSYTHTPDTVHKLKSVYKSVHDIDLFVGGMTEKHVGGGVVGPTFAHIIAKQFHALKHGDSFWYERRQMTDHSSHLNEGQIKAINEWTLAKIICETMNLYEIQKDVFQVPYLGEIWQCHHLPDLDLTHWGCLYPDGSDYLHEEDIHIKKY